MWAAREEILSIGLPRWFIWVCRWIGIHLGHVFLGDQRADPVGAKFSWWVLVFRGVLVR